MALQVKMLKLFHHWWLPILAAATWWSMVVALLILWSRDGFVNYSAATKPRQTVMYISDVGATKYKPIFVGCSAAQGLLFTLSVASEFYLRRIGRLRRHCHWWANWALGLSLLFVLMGQLGILFVAIFDLNAYPSTHVSMLVVFIVFVGVSALLNVASFAALDMTYMNMNRVKIGLWLKVGWFLIEFVLAVLFVGSQLIFVNVPAVFEWAISFLYPFYMLIMAYDLWPAHGKTKGHYPKYNMEYPGQDLKLSADEFPLSSPKEQELFQER